MDRSQQLFTETEAEEARLWVGRHGPRNSWTASNGTAARLIGRLLKERERLLALLAAKENIKQPDES